MMNDNESAEFGEVKLQQLRDATRDLPREGSPPPMAWENIQQRIESARVRELLPSASTLTSSTSKRWRQTGTLAAAAVLIMVVSVATYKQRSTLRQTADQQTAIRPTANEPKASEPKASEPAASTQADRQRASEKRSANSAAAAAITSIFDRYDVAAADLDNDLQQRRARLDPKTVEVLDTCLRKINKAIAEQRSALAEMPDNAAIVGLLTASYEQKLDLLRRADYLPLRSF